MAYFFEAWLQMLQVRLDLPMSAALALEKEGLSKRADFKHRFISEDDIGEFWIQPFMLAVAQRCIGNATTGLWTMTGTAAAEISPRMSERPWMGE